MANVEPLSMRWENELNVSELLKDFYSQHQSMATVCLTNRLLATGLC